MQIQYYLKDLIINEKLNKNFFSNVNKSKVDGKPIKQINENLERAQSEITLLRQELKMKNIELQKLKNFRKNDNKCKTPLINEDFKSPNKSSLSTRRAKQKSRAKTGDIQGNERTNENLNKSNNHSDEYYETTKISPTSSIANSIYSKGIPQIKSSQSWREIEQNNQATNFNTNNLWAVKESEEEQMAETFTKFGKKFAQPQQKEISKK